MIYLASPYSDPDPAIREWRFRVVCAVAAHIIAAGHQVFSPIAHGHPIVAAGVGTGWATWEQMDTHHLRHCEEVWVLELPGWDASRGVQTEMALAKEMGKSVYIMLANQRD